MTQPSDPADPLRELIALSGLTMSQNARLLGFFPRTVLLYLATDSIPARLAARAVRVRDFIAGLPVDSPESRRLLLLASDGGRSLFQLLLDEVPKHEVIQWSALAPRERIGAA